jgi:outer membrane protein
MNRRTLVIALALLGMLLIFALPAQAQTTTGRVAIVNAARVFNEIQETKDLRARLETERASLENEEKERRQRIRDLQSARDQLRPESPQYEERNRELQQALVDFEVWGRIMQNSLQRQQKLQMKNLFDKITVATEEVAKAKQIDLVIAEVHPELPENLDQINVDQLRALINSRNVIFNAPQVDISSDIIAAMDARYRAGN